MPDDLNLKALDRWAVLFVYIDILKNHHNEDECIYGDMCEIVKTLGWEVLAFLFWIVTIFLHQLFINNDLWTWLYISVSYLASNPTDFCDFCNAVFI